MNASTPPPSGLFPLSLRQPPQNMEAEQALLGALLSNNKAFDRIDGLEATHFVDPIHGRIFSAIRSRIEAGRMADVVALKADFDGPDMVEVGGFKYLIQLVAATVGIINAGEYATVITECYRRREAIAIGEALVNAAYAADLDLPALSAVDVAAEGLHALVMGEAGSAAPVTSGEATAAALQELSAAMQRPNGLAGLATGYAALDRLTGGLRAGQFIVLGARPAMGKTAIGLGIAARAAAALEPGDTRKVVFISKEMLAHQMQARLLAAVARLPVTAVTSGRMEVTAGEWRRISQDDMDRVWRDGRRLEELPLLYLHDSETRWSRLSARLRAMHRRGGLALIVVDYIGLLKASDRAVREGRTPAMEEISNAMKALAMELRVPVLCLSQLNRDNEKREDKRPQLADLRQTGSLEQDADVVLMLHREHYYLQANPPKQAEKETGEAFANRCSVWNERIAAEEGRAELRVAKQRQGPTATTRLRWDAEAAFFWDEMDDPETDPLRPSPRPRDDPARYA